MFVGCSFSLSGLVSDEEPRVWGLDAKMPMKVGSVSVTVKQYTEGRLADSRSMMNLSMDGLVAVDNVGGWLGNGALAGGQAPRIARTQQTWTRKTGILLLLVQSWTKQPAACHAARVHSLEVEGLFCLLSMS